MSDPQFHPDPDKIAQWAQKLARIPSPQTDLFEQEPAVQDLVTAVSGMMKDEIGIDVWRDPMGNLIATLGDDTAENSLLLMAYAMTHPASSMADPFSGDIIDVDGRQAVRGRGMAEQKGPLAACLAAVAQAKEADLAGRLVFCLSTAGETGRHDAAQSVFDALGFVPNSGIVAIGTNGEISLGNKGRLDVEILVHGRASHSSNPQAGVNAIWGINKILNQLGTLPFDPGNHAALGPATLTPTFLETSPRATHTVQALAHLTVDRRLVPGQSPEMALEEIKRGLSLEPPFELEIRPGPYMYPAETAEDGDLVERIRAGCTMEGLPAPSTFWCSGALDAGYLQHRGCDAVMWGPGPMAQWHTDNEYVTVEDMVNGARGYYGLVRTSIGRG